MRRQLLTPSLMSTLDDQRRSIYMFQTTTMANNSGSTSKLRKAPLSKTILRQWQPELHTCALVHATINTTQRQGQQLLRFHWQHQCRFLCQPISTLFFEVQAPPPHHSSLGFQKASGITIHLATANTMVHLHDTNLQAGLRITVVESFMLLALLENECWICQLVLYSTRKHTNYNLLLQCANIVLHIVCSLKLPTWWSGINMSIHVFANSQKK